MDGLGGEEDTCRGGTTPGTIELLSIDCMHQLCTFSIFQAMALAKLAPVALGNTCCNLV